MTSNVYWRWRMLYELVLVGTPDPQMAMWCTARLLRAKLRADHETVTTRRI